MAASTEARNRGFLRLIVAEGRRTWGRPENTRGEWQAPGVWEPGAVDGADVVGPSALPAPGGEASRSSAATPGSEPSARAIPAAVDVPHRSTPTGEPTRVFRWAAPGSQAVTVRSPHVVGALDATTSGAPSTSAEAVPRALGDSAKSPRDANLAAADVPAVLGADPTVAPRVHDATPGSVRSEASESRDVTAPGAPERVEISLPLVPPAPPAHRDTAPIVAPTWSSQVGPSFEPAPANVSATRRPGALSNEPRRVSPSPSAAESDGTSAARTTRPSAEEPVPVVVSVPLAVLAAAPAVAGNGQQRARSAETNARAWPLAGRSVDAVANRPGAVEAATPRAAPDFLVPPAASVEGEARLRRPSLSERVTEPSVHIGHIDVIVEAPPAPAPPRPDVGSGLLERVYVRGA
jgi:hypothetical protein